MKLPFDRTNPPKASTASKVHEPNVFATIMLLPIEDMHRYSAEAI